ncbi:PREDICTED: replication protein A 14 kDa subunit-like [Dinoponera quadriceps]|uniref:Replication protein A 14 kDa subunit-like n=1 Tax=Dinoponera quadriceps TaxID=609295 RepID=A0A6P3XPN8_DINQU|nr:PREDICTED: replication protein A 14 kDa subunit-like [Dinoponera quadriceps]XP_014480376.1 PREDICTED: replication protein A 14 kDa subunit-like [Dinoponera quadriceps]
MSDKRTLGKRLGQRVGKEAIVLGRITEKSANGMNIELTTTDNALINVTLPQPLDHNASGYIEVRGTVKSKSTLLCKNFVCFPPDITKTFDETKYNNIMNIRHAIGDQLDGIFYEE